MVPLWVVPTGQGKLGTVGLFGGGVVPGAVGVFPLVLPGVAGVAFGELDDEFGLVEFGAAELGGVGVVPAVVEVPVVGTQFTLPDVAGLVVWPPLGVPGAGVEDGGFVVCGVV